uniref:Structural protein n=1 Tax=Panagrellus redivivus TaxID=6233 RepID=A0A7E4VWV3_PANRE
MVISNLNNGGQAERAQVAPNDSYAHPALTMTTYQFNDLDEGRLYEIGNEHGIQYLSPATVPTPPFPVTGFMTNLRSMVPLVVQRGDEPTNNGVNVWFLYHTGSPDTYITEKVMNALGITDADESADGFYTIKLQGTTLRCRKSNNTFEEVNIFGTKAMMEMKLSSVMNNKANDTIEFNR